MKTYKISDFEVGEVVYLKSDFTIEMVISTIDENEGLIRCYWRDKSKKTTMNSSLANILEQFRGSLNINSGTGAAYTSSWNSTYDSSKLLLQLIGDEMSPISISDIINPECSVTFSSSLSPIMFRAEK